MVVFLLFLRKKGFGNGRQFPHLVVFCKRIFPKADNSLTKKSAPSVYTVHVDIRKEGVGEL